MDTKDLIELIRKAVWDVKSQNQSVVSADALLNYLTSIEAEVGRSRSADARALEVDLAKFRADHERNLAHYNATQATSIEMLKSVITFGQTALKNALLINGGAAVALLAFIGNIWGEGIAQNAVAPITNGVILFAFGVLAAALGAGTSYVAQYCYHYHHNKAAKAFHGLTLVIVVLTYIFFAFGAWEAYTGFVKHLAVGS